MVKSTATDKLDLLKPYFDAYSRASDRTRSVYLIILAYSVISISVFVNSSGFGWAQSRLQKARIAYTYFEDHNSASTSPIIQRLNAKEVAEALDFIALAHIRTLEEAKSDLNNALKQVADSKVIVIPLFGLSFQTNDLGFISGLALICLMQLLKHMLIREVDNLKLVVEKSGHYKVDKKETYALLSTGEVLNRPDPLSGERKGATRTVVNVPIFLLFVPTLSYALIWAFDFQTRSFGYYLSYSYAHFIVAFEIIALSWLIFLAYSCYITIRDADQTWAKLQADAKKNV